MDDVSRSVSVRNDAGIRQIARAPRNRGNRDFLAINNSGQVVFQFGRTGAVPGGPLYLWNGSSSRRIADPASPFSNFLSATINESGEVAFDARSDEGRESIYFWNGTTPREIPLDPEEFPSPKGASINNSGAVAFGAFTGRGWQIAVWDGTTARRLIDTSDTFWQIWGFSINNTGAVAFAADLRSDPRVRSISVISAGERHEVVRSGAFIGGREVQRVEIGREGFSDRGSLVFYAYFVDGSEAIVRADPEPVSGLCDVSGASDPPVCHCLRDELLNSLRCAFLDPSFLAISRMPWPISAGRDYLLTWEILPLTQLAGPVSVQLSGANIAKPIDLNFAGKSLKTLETRKVTLKAPSQPSDLPGSAVLTYQGRSWKINTTIPAQQFLTPQKDLTRLKKPSPRIKEIPEIDK